MASSVPDSDLDYNNSLKAKGRSFLETFLAVDRFLFRPLAWLIVRAVIKTPISPNQLTVSSFCLGMTAAVLFATGKPRDFTVAGIFVILSGVVDCADGMLARAKNMASEYGGFLDISLDRIVDFFLIAGMALGFYVHTGQKLILPLGIFAAGLMALQNTLWYLGKAYRKDMRKGELGELRSGMFLLFLLGALFRRLDLVIFVVLAESGIYVLLRPAQLFRLRKTAPVVLDRKN